MSHSLKVAAVCQAGKYWLLLAALSTLLLTWTVNTVTESKRCAAETASTVLLRHAVRSRLRGRMLEALREVVMVHMMQASLLSDTWLLRYTPALCCTQNRLGHQDALQNPKFQLDVRVQQTCTSSLDTEIHDVLPL